MSIAEIAKQIPGYDPFATAGDAWFDAAIAQRACDFFPEVLRHVEGALAGEPFRLEPWQQAIVANLFGWLRTDKAGRTVRRYRESLIFVPRKNGKTALAAGIGLYYLFCDPEKGQQNYIAASTREQAGLLFRHAKGMVHGHPTLTNACRIYGGTAPGGQSQSIVRDKVASFLKAVAADVPVGQHGKAVNLVVIDEVHEHRNREVVDAFRTAMASANKPSPLMLYLTTADYDRPSICNELYERAVRVRDGVFADPAFLPVVYEAAATDDWTAPQVWRKANPNFGVSVSEDYFEQEVKRCGDNPATLNQFLRLHLNIRTKQATRWIEPADWRACGGAVDLGALRGKNCYGGLDLSAKYDLTAFVVAWPDDGAYVLWPQFWIPEETARKYEQLHGLPFRQWARAGHITITPGASVDYESVEAAVLDAQRRFALKGVAYDPWNANASRSRLEGQGVTMVEFQQSLKRFNEPTKEFGRLVREGELRHGGHPVLAWNADCVEVWTDTSGNIRPVKPADGTANKIDGIVAAIMAVAGAMLERESEYVVHMIGGE